MHRSILSLGFVVVLSWIGAAQSVTLITTEDEKLTVSDATASASFGHSVSVSHDTAIVGAPGDDSSGPANSGSAYVFGRNLGGLDNWGEVTKLTAPDAAFGDEFGTSVSISGDIVVIGASLDDDAGPDSGSAYVFARNHGGPDNWGLVEKLTASDAAADDQFGTSVSISGDTALVGSPRDDDAGNASGSTYVFARNQGGPDNWGQVTKLTADDAAPVDLFGFAVSISGPTVVVGALAEDDAGPNSGAAYVFDRDEGGADNWGQVAKLTASDAATEERFGFAVSVSVDLAVVGAFSDAHVGPDSGSAYVFGRDQGGPGNWGEIEKLTASDAAAGDRFGFGVSISGDKVIVGSPQTLTAGTGSAYMFDRNQGGPDNWGEVLKLVASDGFSGDLFGFSVSISGDTALAGAPGDDHTGGNNAGSAYVFAVPECFLVLGDGDTNGTWSYLTGTHEFPTQVGQVDEAYAVTTDQIPSFRMLPEQPARPMRAAVPALEGNEAPRLARRAGPTPTGPSSAYPMRTLYAQVLMWNPEAFPSNPEQYSSGLAVTVWSNGTVSATPYGAQDGMTIWLHTYRGTDGVDYFQLPFGIDW